MDSIVDSLQYIVKENPHENYLDDINPDEDEGNEDVDDEKNGDDEGDDDGDDDDDDDGAEKCGWPVLESVAWHPDWLSSASLMDDLVIIAIIEIIIVIANIIIIANIIVVIANITSASLLDPPVIIAIIERLSVAPLDMPYSYHACH